MPSPDLISLFVAPLEGAGVTYMVTGAVAAIVYGEPRLTNDVDIVISLEVNDVPRLRSLFDRPDYHVPDASAIIRELERPRHGHFNVIHARTATKADFYPAGDDPLHRWALSRRRHVDVGMTRVAVAPPEYVVVRKLEYLKAGGSDKHLTDIQGMLDALGPDIDLDFLTTEVERRGLRDQWQALGRHS